MQLRDTVKTQLVNFLKKTILLQELHYSPLVLVKSSCLSSLFQMDVSPIKCENKKILTFEVNISQLWGLGTLVARYLCAHLSERTFS